MRYIKKFNEASSDSILKQEIQDFCEINLAYLMDDGMIVYVVRVDLEDHEGKTSGISKMCVDLAFRAINKPSGGVKWMDIKDHMIPFLTRLKAEYNLYDMDRYGHTYQLEVDRKPEHESGSFEYCLTIDGVIGEKESILETGIIKHIRFYI